MASTTLNSTPISNRSPEDSENTSLCSSDDGNNPHVATSPEPRVQTPIAIVGMGCRLPGHSNSPTALWDLLKRGEMASNVPPATRFNLAGHFDGTRRPRTMKSAGGMFLEDVDPAVFDGQFFSISRADCIAMDPQQRQLLEVAYECLENGGIPLEKISGTKTGVIVGNSFTDYAAIQNRDPEDRADSITVGLSPSILSNRISHFLNVTGPSMSIDTACSGSLVSLDVACRFLDSNQAEAMIVGGTNMWLAPEHNEEVGTMNMTMSASGKCQSFDANADGYVKAEGINIVYLKRLDDAIRDNDPIRAIIRGTASNASGRTAGIANPSSEAQAAVTRTAYKNAGISDFLATQYVECHGTGTLTGDPIEVRGVASVFGPGRQPGRELIIGSIKSNIGHSEAAAGLSGLLKATMAVERGQIPGNPTFITPSPKIDWKAFNLRASRTLVPWPRGSIIRRASVNSFGFGGANAHVVLENATSSPHVSSYQTISSNFFDDDEDEDEDSTGEETEDKAPPKLLVLSANDPNSLMSYAKALSSHFLNPMVSVDIDNLAYTLSERRSKLYHRAFAITRSTKTKLTPEDLVTGKQAASPPRIGFVFTGQGAQWSQMGAELVKNFPIAQQVIEELDGALKSLPEPPQWTLLEELTSARTGEALRQPEFSQPLVTALQLALLEVLNYWGVRPEAVVGHSSGEIAAAAAAGLLTYADAIKTAFYRGQAAKKVGTPAEPVGMLAIGIGAEKVQPYLRSEEKIQIACYNSPDSLTMSGTRSALEKLRDRIQADGHFARLLLVDLAYHSDYMAEIGEVYEKMLLKDDLFQNQPAHSNVRMFSSVTGKMMQPGEKPDAAYWKSNMVSPVRFTAAASELLRDGELGANFLIELGPSNALSGPVAQIKKSLAGKIGDVPYSSALTRGEGSTLALYKSAGQLFLAGGAVSLTRVNRIAKDKAKMIVDLPNYSWNHSNRYWHETRASKEWRFKKFVNHDLLGSKIPATAWQAPTFKKLLKLADVPWLKDHLLGSEIVFPGAAYIAMAVEAVYQTTMSVQWNHQAPPRYRFRLRDVQILRALVLEEKSETRMTLSLTPVKGGSTRTWYEFRVCSMQDDAPVDQEHSAGFVCIETDYQSIEAPADSMRPLEFPTPARVWYKALADMGYKFGPCFQKHVAVESSIGKRTSRSTVSLEPPPSNPLGQSRYPLHPAVMDSCLQATSPSLWRGEPPTSGSAVLVPKIIGSMVIEGGEGLPTEGEGMALASANWVGIGDAEHPRNFTTNVQVFHPQDGTCLFEMKGLQQGEIEVGETDKVGHTFTRVAWDADVNMLLKSQSLAAQQWIASKEIRELVDLVAHKKPGLSCLELNLDAEDASSIWLDEQASAMRAACSQYHVGVRNSKAMLSAQESLPGAQIHLVDAIKGVEIVADTKFDLVIVKGSQSEVAQEVLIQTLAASVHADGFVITSGLDEAPLKRLGTTFTAKDGSSICQKEDKKEQSTPQIIKQVSFCEPEAQQSSEAAHVLEQLTSEKWAIQASSAPLTDVSSSKDIVVVIDELFHSLLDGFNEQQWEVLKHLLNQRCRLLWVTTGAQLSVTDPNKAAITGLLRTIRSEEQIRFITLDVENPTGEATTAAISACLDQLSSDEDDGPADSEFVERSGVTYISRIVPDAKLTVLQSEDISEQLVETVDFHECESLVRLRCERLGNLDSLHFGETSPEVLPLAEGFVEVEIYAAGLNYKDVVVSMGYVPGDESQLGFEAAGVVKKVSSSVSSYTPGDRVVVWSKGCFANRIHTLPARMHRIPDSLSFEDAATLPVVYVTSLHALFDQGNLSEGKTVLIHSAAGGVGIAAIQLAQYVGAKVFATVSSPEKRQFLQTTFGLRDEDIFNSRNTDFAENILAATNGRGVDVVLNSLTGDMLDESFRILADGGIMVEIGKKDILDRNKLTMTPFDRNISFRAVDLSAERAPDALIERSLAKLFELLEGGHIKPINPVHCFSWSEIPSAIRFLRPGTHIGKVVLSDGADAKVQVPIRRAAPKLPFRDDRCYLIVGGLRGLCGSLAVYLAKQGAKNLAVMSRSGHTDQKSQGIVKQISGLGAHIDLLTADVTNAEDVVRAFGQTRVPIAGIIQGAMVLRDRPFDQMTLAEYHEAAQCKTRGTWNLHDAAEKLNLNLGFFTLLSSISGVIGNRGQGNYAAANTFLDSFAEFRRSRGQAACSVDLGVIEDAGVIAEREQLQNVFDTRVFSGINNGLLAKILYVSVLQQQAHPRASPAASAQLITGLIVPQPSDSQLNKDARFSALFAGQAGANAEGSGGASGKDAEVQLALMLLKNESTDEPAKVQAMVGAINSAFVRMLHLPEAMDSERPLSVYGIDSLAAVELRNWIRTELNALVTTLDVLNAASLTKLSEKVIAKIMEAN
ncbi:PKSKA1 [Corynespora cassiicola Philippines]|uniref:PKSKA1 n=1 Tax=Corynespora cassiicola Philippines TaxID=1448308 RepID=A0A2T2N3D5_CORCC|nr:PKSKA1 [Corynespora cassiicola Philippines]